MQNESQFNWRRDGSLVGAPFPKTSASLPSNIFAFSPLLDGYHYQYNFFSLVSCFTFFHGYPAKQQLLVKHFVPDQQGVRLFVSVQLPHIKTTAIFVCLVAQSIP
jgi:hypothetical protein